MSQKVIEVARAIYDAGRPLGYKEWWQLSSSGRARYEHIARAAMTAMLNPDHEMTEAVVPAGEDRTQACEDWNAMLKNALVP